MKQLLSLFALSLTLLVALPSYSQTVWGFESYQKGDRVYFSTATYEEAGEGEKREATLVRQEKSELLTLPDDVRERQEQFFGEREDVFLPSTLKDNIPVSYH